MDSKAEAAIVAYALKRMGWDVEVSANEILVEPRNGPVVVSYELDNSLTELRERGILRSECEKELGSFHFAAVLKIVPQSVPAQNAWSTRRR